MDRHNLIKQMGEVRMATTDQILSGEATEEDREIHRAAGEALVKLLIREVEVEDCLHELIARYGDGTAECELCGAKLCGANQGAALPTPEEL